MVDSMAPLMVTNRQLIVGGDFNAVLDGSGDASADYVGTFLKRAALYDGGKVVKPSVDGPTWRNTRGISRRLDYIFVNKTVKVKTGKTIPLFFSDHDGVMLTVQSEAPRFGSGYWRLNLEVLKERDFHLEFLNFFKGMEGLKVLCEGLVEWWEAVKCRIRIFIIRYCKNRAREAKRGLNYIQKQLEISHARLNYGGMPHLNEIELIKGELRDLNERRARAHIMRSRHEWLENNEKCTASFFSTAKIDKIKQVFTGLKIIKGK